MKDKQRATTRTGERGFSLVEIVVAMLLLTLMTLGMLPLFLGAVQISTSNRSLVAATTFANAQLAELRAAFGNDTVRPCSDLVDPALDYLRVGFPDPADTGLIADRTAASSPCGGPKYDTVTITVTVHPADNPGRHLVTLTSQVLVSNP